MKTLFATSVSVLLLLTAGVALANSENMLNDGTWASGLFAANVIWPQLLFAVSLFWQPFLFASVIVGFGTWVFHRLYRKED